MRALIVFIHLEDKKSRDAKSLTKTGKFFNQRLDGPGVKVVYLSWMKLLRMRKRTQRNITHSSWLAAMSRTIVRTMLLLLSVR